MKKTLIEIPGGVKLSFESEDAAGVPDTTTDAGPDTIELHEDAQKPADSPAAEYNAEEHVDTPEDVEKANESTFLGVTIRRRSEEGFGLKTKGSYASADAFFKSPECKAAVETAKAWATKKKWALASIADTKGAKGLKAAGFKFVSAFGATFAYIDAKGKLNVNILFKEGAKITQKAFAKVTLATKPAAAKGKKKGVESFYSLTVALRAQEGFALKRTIDAYRNADEFFKGSEFKGVLATAKKWAEGKGYASIPVAEAKTTEPSKTAKFLEKGWTLKSVAGNTFLIREKRETKGGIIGKDNIKDHSLDICILFKTDKSKLIIKLFAKLKLAKGGGVASSESAVMSMLGIESTDGIDDTQTGAAADAGTDTASDATSIVAAAADDAASADTAAAAGDGSAAASGTDDVAAASAGGDDAAASQAQSDIDAGAAGAPGASSDDTVTTVEVETADISDVDPETGALDDGDGDDDDGVDEDDLGIGDDANAGDDSTVVIAEGADAASSDDDDDDEIADSSVDTGDASADPAAAAADTAAAGDDSAAAATDGATGIDDDEKSLESFFDKYLKQ